MTRRRIVTLPRSLMRMLAVGWDIDWRGRSTGDTVNGINQIVHTAFPRWTGEATLHLRRETLLHWRAVRMAAQGQVNIYRVPMVDPLALDFASATAGTAATGIPFSTAQPFSTGQGFAHVPTCVAATDAAAGAPRTPDSGRDVRPAAAGRTGCSA